jgi:hypothetical protein
MGKVVGKRPLSRPRCKWDDIIEIDIQEVGCGRMDCIGFVKMSKWGKLEERDLRTDRGVNGMILFKLIFRK